MLASEPRANWLVSLAARFSRIETEARRGSESDGNVTITMIHYSISNLLFDVRSIVGIGAEFIVILSNSQNHSISDIP